ncbi:MAG: WYL domain-containing protein [Thomasclavelia sp.]|nr:WYL domain-containing protein [Thomasclavelia sp.]
MIERMCYTYLIIKESNDPITASDIQIKLEDYDIFINVKTVYKAINNINELTTILFNKSIIKTIHRIGYKIDDEIFSDGELQFLKDSILYNQDLSKSKAHNFSSLLDVFSSSNQLERLASCLNDSYVNNDSDLFLYLSNILKAIHTKSNISFNYMDYKIKNKKLVLDKRDHGNKDKYTYVVSPYQLIFYQSRYYLLAFNDNYPDRITTYRLDRMQKVRSVKGEYVDCNIDYDIYEVIKNGINMYIGGENKTLTLRIDSSITGTVIDRFGRDIQVDSEFNGKYQLTIKDVKINNGLIGWILMLRDQIEVIYPISLRDTLKQTLNNLMNTYQD